MKLFSTISLITFTISFVFIQAQEIPDDQYFWIQSAVNVGKNPDGCWDVPGYPKDIKEGKTQNIQVYTIDSGPDRLFKFNQVDEDEYKIIPKHGEIDFCVRAENNTGKNGTNLIIAEEDNEEELENFRITYKGNGLWRIYSQSGDIVCLKGKSSKNKSNIHLWDNHEGAWTEWALVDPTTSKVFIPEDEDDENVAEESFEATSKKNELKSELAGKSNQKFTGPESKKLSQNITNTYKELYKVEEKVADLNSQLEKANKILKKTTVISDNLNELDAKITRSHGALAVFTKIPFVGPAATGLQTTIGIVKGKIDGVNTKVKKLEKPVITPANEGFNKLYGTSSILGDKLASLCSQITTINDQYCTAANCVAASNDPKLISAFEQKSAALNNKISGLNSDLSNIKNEISKIEKMTAGINKLEKPIKAADKGIKVVNKKFKKVDKAAKNIDKVLNKEFKKKILGKKFSISIKKILSGGKLGKAIQKPARKFAEKALKPVLKKLKIKIPEVPGLDKITKGFDEIKDSVNEVKKLDQKVAVYNTKVDELKSSLDTQLKDCISGLPCN